MAVSVSMIPTMAVASGPSPAATVASVPAGPGVMAVAMPVAGSPALLLAKKKKKKGSSGGLTPDSAEEKRQAIRDAVASDVEGERWSAAAEETENNAALLGDPVSYQQAAEYRLEQAKADRDIDAANAAIETATIALDIFHFYDAVDSGEAVSDWKVIDPSTAAGSASEVEGLIERAEELIEEIEAEQAETDDGGGGGSDAAVAKKKRKKRGKAKPGTVFLGVGAGLAAVGLAGAAAGIAGLVISSKKQEEVEGFTGIDQQADRDRLDEEGSRANLIGWVGLGVGAVGLAAGTALIVVGVMRRKKAGPSSSARIQVAPSFTAKSGGLVLQGRF